jgi:hypothetical protein
MAAAAQRRGIEAVILPFPKEGFAEALTSYLDQNDAIICFQLLIADPLFLKRLTKRSLLGRRSVRAKVIGLIHDHPFSWFLQPGIMAASSDYRFLLADEVFVHELTALNPNLVKARKDILSHSPLTYVEPCDRVAFNSRAIDVLVPLSVTRFSENGSITAFLERLGASLIRDIAQQTYDECAADPKCNLFAVFQRVAELRSGTTLDDLRRTDQATHANLLFILGSLDEVIRQARRNQMISELLRSTGKLNVVVAADPMTWLKVDKNVKFVGRISGHKFGSVLANSKLVMNCNPTYPRYVHERVTNAMAYGCAVISDINVGLADRFKSGELIAYSPGNRRTVRDVFAESRLEDVGKAAANHIATDPRYTWDSHLSVVLDAAQ